MRDYIKKYFVFLSGIIILISLPVLFIYSSGEYLSVEDIVIKQRTADAKVIYGAALFNSTQYYKKILLEKSSPRVVVLGSSTVLQFRQHMFRKQFVNLGRTMSDIKSGFNMIAPIKMAKPEYIFIGADTWWFNSKYKRSAPARVGIVRIDPRPDVAHAKTLIEWILQGKISLYKVFDVLMQGSEDIGISGLYKEGYGVDGSYYYTRLVTGLKSSDDLRFRDTLNRIDEGKSRFDYEKNADLDRVDKFIELVRNLETEKTRVIVFLPPFADRVNTEMARLGRKYGYIEDLKQKLMKRGIDVLDYRDVSQIGSSDCEFIDGFHGGETTSMRILEDMARQRPELSEIIDADGLEEKIRLGEGKAFFPDPSITRQPEIDFLKLGCSKK